MVGFSEFLVSARFPLLLYVQETQKVCHKTVSNFDKFVHFEHFCFHYSNAKKPINISCLQSKLVIAEAFS